jgi:hypothetical protein
MIERESTMLISPILLKSQDKPPCSLELPLGIEGELLPTQLPTLRL